jgi:hypothetical protein
MGKEADHSGDVDLDGSQYGYWTGNKNRVCGCGLDSSGWEHKPVHDYCEH